jgi:hypothetical protein
LHDDDISHVEALIVADVVGLLRRNDMDGFKGRLVAKALAQAQYTTQRLKEFWEHAHEIIDFRQLSL